MLTSLREAMREGRGPIERIRGYRSGYLPSERRAIEAGLRSGEVLGVVSTNALELGIDIGRLDVSVLAGYPGTIAAAWQQMGRAGRRGEPSVSLLVAGAGALDRFVATHPEYLFEATPEEARLDPENVHVLLAHLRAATFELPFDPGESFGAGAADDLLAFLAEEGHVRQADDARWYWASENFPASEINLRVAAPENVLIIDTGPERPRVLGEVDLFAARVLVHEKAIYLHDSRQYHVDELDWEERKALVRPVDTDYYTQAELAVTLKPLDVFDSAPRAAGSRHHGEVMISSIATIFKKLKLDTHENVGWGHIHLPEMELHTTAWWLALDPGAVDVWRRDELDAALVGAGRALQTVASVLLMADPRDLGMVAQVQSPHAERPVIYLWEAVPGGVGLSIRMFERTEELVDGAFELVTACGCEVGCPACVGPRGESRLDGRAVGHRLLGLLMTPATRRAVAGRAGGVTSELARADASLHYVSDWQIEHTRRSRLDRLRETRAAAAAAAARLRPSACRRGCAAARRSGSTTGSRCRGYRDGDSGPAHRRRGEPGGHRAGARRACASFPSRSIPACRSSCWTRRPRASAPARARCRSSSAWAAGRTAPS